MTAPFIFPGDRPTTPENLIHNAEVALQAALRSGEDLVKIAAEYRKIATIAMAINMAERITP